MSVWELILWSSVFACAYTVLGYPLLLWLVGKCLRRPASRPKDDDFPAVSIVLAAYNEAGWIRRKLENCLALDYPAGKLEIVVGSDGSDDGTNEIVAQCADPRIRFHAFAPRRGKMATVNRLVRVARGDVCVFSDIAELFDLDALRKLVRHFADPQIGAVTGNHTYHSQQTGLSAGTLAYWKFQRFLQQVESTVETICQCDGTIYACRRELFPFPPDNTINDDVAVPLGILCRGKRVILEPQALARGDVLQGAARLFRQRLRGQAGKYQNFVMASRMFLPWPPARWWIFMSHCVLPVLFPWFLVAALLSNAALLGSGNGLYQGLFLLQFAFYAMALVGLLAEQAGWRVPLAAVPFYVVTAIAASLCGFVMYASGAQHAAWGKVDQEPTPHT